jgi:HSP20 family protein
MATEKRKSEMASEGKSSPKLEVLKTSPARALSPFEEMDRMFENFFHRGWMRPLHWERPAWAELPVPFEGKMPRVDVIDRDGEIVVRAEVPGVDKNDLDVSVTENSVTIKGSTRREEKEEKGDYFRCETTQGSFSRTVSLPCDVDNEKAKTKFKDGILELTLPKMEKTKRRSIKIE